jgi:hypothetical protein
MSSPGEFVPVMCPLSSFGLMHAFLQLPTNCTKGSHIWEISPGLTGRIRYGIGVKLTSRREVPKANL